MRNKYRHCLQLFRIARNKLSLSFAIVSNSAQQNIGVACSCFEQSATKYRRRMQLFRTERNKILPSFATALNGVQQNMASLCSCFKQCARRYRRCMQMFRPVCKKNISVVCSYFQLYSTQITPLFAVVSISAQHKYRRRLLLLKTMQNNTSRLFAVVSNNAQHNINVVWSFIEHCLTEYRRCLQLSSTVLTKICPSFGVVSNSTPSFELFRTLSNKISPSIRLFRNIRNTNYAVVCNCLS